MNLNTATEQELDQYREKVASIIGLDPMMLDYIWVFDQESQLRNRVLYAKRGAAEIIRHQRFISVTSLTPYESNGWLMFTAVGTIPSGRQEIAVGAAYVEGHKADKKAHAVMTAQTRAVRRLTLQFVGGGILDETEVQTQNDLMAQPAASAATLAGSPVVVPTIPTVAPAPAPGRDVTAATPPPPPVAPQPDIKADIVSGSMLVAHPVSTTSAVSPAAEIPDTGETEAKPKRKPRAKKTVDLASPGQTSSVQPATANEPEQGVNGNGALRTPALAEPAPHPLINQADNLKQVYAEGAAALAAMPLPAPPAPAPANPVPTNLPTAAVDPVKLAKFKERFRVYSCDILPRGGMLNSDGIGGITMKLRKFSESYEGMPTQRFGLAQWEHLLGFLDGFAKQFGEGALVHYIDTALGVAKA